LGVVAKFVDPCFELEYTSDEAYDLVETYFEGLRDVFVHKDFPSLGGDIVLPNPLDHSYVSPMCS